MALARIITRSQQCSRELALDLLARGYAVEIVSPDKIPDNLADLELRVDAGPGDRLIASVEAHDGERSASLEFVHHLKAPMMDFMRRHPEPVESLPIPDQLSVDAEPAMEDVELHADAPQLIGETAFAEIEIPHDARVDTFEGTTELTSKENELLVSLPEPVPALPPEPMMHFAERASPIDEPVAQPALEQATISPTTIPQSTASQPTIIRPIPSSRPPDRSAGWRWRAALTFASVVVLALVLGFGLRQTGKASARTSEAAPAEKVAAASSEVELWSAAGTGKDAGKPAPFAVLPSAKSEGNSVQLQKEAKPPQAAQPAKSGSASAPTSTAARPHNTPRKAPRQHGDDLIAHDTVTYLDKSYAPPPKTKSTKKLAQKHPVSHGHGGVIAANSVTYIAPDPAPKTPK
jgi:hypothetical protein